MNTLKQQSVTLCGNPQPQLEWKVGSRIINGTVDESFHRQHRYTYHIAFESITYTVCGKIFSYVAIGYKNEEIFEEMLILPQPGLYLQNLVFVLCFIHLFIYSFIYFLEKLQPI